MQVVTGPGCGIHMLTLQMKNQNQSCWLSDFSMQRVSVNYRGLFTLTSLMQIFKYSNLLCCDRLTPVLL